MKNRVLRSTQFRRAQKRIMQWGEDVLGQIRELLNCELPQFRSDDDCVTVYGGAPGELCIEQSIDSLHVDLFVSVCGPKRVAEFLKSLQLVLERETSLGWTIEIKRRVQKVGRSK